MNEYGEQRGINLSPRQAVADWTAVRANAVSFASITVTEGMNWTDERAARQLVDAYRAGVHAGIRHYARPGAPQEQAKHLAQTGTRLGALVPGSLAPALDVGAEGIDDRFVKAWIKSLRQCAGIRRVLVYAPYEHWQRRLHPDKWADDEVVLWLVRHNGIPGRPGWFHSRLGLHQHGNGGGYGNDALVYPFTLADIVLRGR
ncbi:lysozyme M1 (1,4-beta-N-acetylmuramidase) [Saccharomonospora marina XMU15]|uniref:Lysozyme M1 (1,4-beta-N-acetylmuramidase) n=1 Tax=Saccharomonospora marina XMU15 TaxID=882083 RepID=H5XBT5_9PSEU|nr:GH25 family lysozyme [Saccharomonospora marina]EHR52722.1 lysozyme M1 (1,4-beta-N-acetylmuramidase) [Saccharomonospora marina XMU15]